MRLGSATLITGHGSTIRSGAIYINPTCFAETILATKIPLIFEFATLRNSILVREDQGKFYLGRCHRGSLSLGGAHRYALRFAAYFDNMLTGTFPWSKLIIIIERSL